MQDKLWPLVVFLLVLLGLLLLLYGCGTGTPLATSWQSADTHAEGIGEKITQAAGKVSGTAGEIIIAARDGRNATPEAMRPTLDPFWIKILANGQLMLAQGDVLRSIRQDIDTLRGEVQAGKKQLADTQSALDAEKQGRAKDNKDWEAKLAKANSRWEAMFRTLSWLAIAAIGISVTVGVLLHDFRISIAGGAGGLAVVIACMIVGQIQHWLPWLAGGLIALVILWVLIESLLRGSLQEAIRTSPVQDLKDLSGAPAAAI